MSTVELRGINKSYVNFVALNDIDLTVPEGEFLTLLGASGSGKTTLLNIVAGMIAPDSGAVLIGDRDVTDVPPRQRGLGMVFQSYALVPHMSVFDNIAFPLRIRRMSPADIKSRVERILDIVQLGHIAHRKPRELSGGQQQRVAIARCLVYEPPVILMDEPLGALDKKLREQLQQEIRRIHKEMGITILYVTHDQEEALYLSDRICLMNGGQIEQLGTPHELYFQPANAFVADFIGESNLLSCNHVASDRVRIDTLGQEIHVLPNGAAAPDRLLIRPDKIAVLAEGESRPNEFSGEIEAVAFVGETVRLTVRCGRQTFTVKAPTGSPADMRNVGSTARIGWHPEEALLLSC
ncbi:ABC transporter ATP-binding protein [Falsochrobactrum sp. TDYN1]|uniref:ABC transporter ATP-binding protein n=1 Tax=Falsochrobactrum tianjinense TaxID=2706015 RepID=A0A949PSB3_9HYPH|nr:ABC transporter ATP-binding protein [Falsochrobactrum sp. TDYN1]MBV2145106.1 ABC transporter ATP-binding protein [Falsochrobactrum sp. TDYN1]